MKTVFSLVIALCGMNFIALGQTQTVNTEVEAPARVVQVGNPDETAKQVADNINTLVKLSPEQYNKILEITKNGFQKRQAQLSNSIDNNNPTALEVRVDASDMEQQILSVLNPEQRKIIESQKDNSPTISRTAVKVSSNIQLQEANPASEKK